MDNKNSAFNDFLKPIIVLVLICFVVTGALAAIYGVTNPIIQDNATKEANEARNILLPAAESGFEEYTGELFVLEENKVYVSDCYTATNGAGSVITVKTNSYGGILTAMIGIDSDGAVTSVLVTDAADTPGVGTKAQAESHLAQYTGKTELGNENVKKDNVIDHVTGASVSSTAIHKAVWCALEQNKMMGGAA
jgi:electron transport complex protein RnfG